MDYDVLVVGSGIGGMESALKLAEMGKKVLLVEKEASIGGRMILLSKVFPTLDCASCISGPKMSSTINHPNITVQTYSEVHQVARAEDGSFRASVTHKARFVDVDACTGCGQCEQACTVAVPDQFNAGLAPRRAAYIPFPQAVPKKAVLDRAGTSPCIAACPAGIKAHGYVSLARSGKFEEAFQLNLDATPFVGTLGRACYAPCENGCTRGQLDGTVPIRLIKRYVADAHYAAGDRPAVDVAAPQERAIAIVGSGPAGSTAAWHLARGGYRVTVLESASVPGGMPRTAIPDYRLPGEVVQADIENLSALGVEIRCQTRVTDLRELKDNGYDAVIVATGTSVAEQVDLDGGGADGVVTGLDLLREAADPRAWTGRRVIVLGGSNVAMDCARVSLRRGAAAVTIVVDGERKQLSCQDFEVDQAQSEGVRIVYSAAAVCVLADGDQRVRALRCRVGDEECELPADVIVTTGLSVEGDLFHEISGTGKQGRIAAHRKTLQTKESWLFAAGDVVNGPTSIVRAVGSGRRAAHMVDRWLRGRPLDGFTVQDSKLPTAKHALVLDRQAKHSRREPITASQALTAPPVSFDAIEQPLSISEVIDGASSCLDCGICSECHQCVEACPVPDCIDFDARDRQEEITVGAVIVATGHRLFAADLKPEYGYGRFTNVITGMQMDRLLAPTRPFNTVLRPGDGKVPERIAYVSCTGSRDKQVGNPLCSAFCCMYSVKQNQLIMGALPLADVTMHYMDLRAAGKRYDEFYQQAKDMGALYVKGRVASIAEKDNGDLILRYEDIENGGVVVEAEYDLVVLAVGIQPNRDVEALFEGEPLGMDEFHYVAEPSLELEPGCTTVPGVFVAGTAAGAKDIVDTILHSGAAVAQAAAHLERRDRQHCGQEVPA